MPTEITVFERLYNLILKEGTANPDTSYIAKRFQQSRAKIAQKLGEESVETVIAAVEGHKDELVSESADLIFSWLILLAEAKVPVNNVMAELERREKILATEGHPKRKWKKKS